VWAQPVRAGATLEVIGSWDGWLVPGIALRPAEEPGWWVARVDGDVPPGEYGYLILEDGEHRIDEHNPLTTFWAEQGDLEVSLLQVADCSLPGLTVTDVTVEGDRVRVAASFAAAADGAAGVTVRASQGSAEIDDEGQVIAELAAGERGKHSVTLTVTDDAGRTATARASAFVRAAAPRWADGLLYQVVTDRFRGDGGVALAAPDSPGGRAGGTLRGITAEIEAGNFAAMGVTALWISPVYVNPEEAREGRGDGHLYEGYHGYWPLAPRGVDPRIGGEAALDELVATAHAAGIKVLLDVVPNHVYEASPRYAEHPEWFNHSEPTCVCGIGSCDWGTHIQSCWFTDYLPDVHMQDAGALRLAYEDLLWWQQRFDVDGVRVDAVPMMPLAATRRMAHELRGAVAGERPFLIGEVYTGAGTWGVDVIRYYLGPDGLDSVFDFPLMWAIRDVLAHESAGFVAIEDMLVEVETATAGSGAVLGQILGNHDVTRFFSEAHGDAGGDPWSEPAVQAPDAVAFARLRSALTLLLTLPGLPVLYYGDEVGLAGGNDPDNRRVLPAFADLSAEQQATLALVRRLGPLRGCVAGLRTGTRTAVVVEADVYGFERGDGEAVVLMSRSPTPRSVLLRRAGAYVDVLSGEAVTVSAAGTAVSLGPRQPRVLVRADLQCAGT
jgi:glycosidase